MTEEDKIKARAELSFLWKDINDLYIGRISFTSVVKESLRKRIQTLADLLKDEGLKHSDRM